MAKDKTKVVGAMLRDKWTCPDCGKTEIGTPTGIKLKIRLHNKVVHATDTPNIVEYGIDQTTDNSRKWLPRKKRHTPFEKKIFEL
jgi:transcription elongation factor Elf1